MSRLFNYLFSIIIIFSFTNVFALQTNWSNGIESQVRIISPSTHTNNQNELYLSQSTIPRGFMYPSPETSFPHEKHRDPCEIPSFGRVLFPSSSVGSFPVTNKCPQKGLWVRRHYTIYYKGIGQWMVAVSGQSHREKMTCIFTNSRSDPNHNMITIGARSHV